MAPNEAGAMAPNEAGAMALNEAGAMALNEAGAVAPNEAGAVAPDGPATIAAGEAAAAVHGPDDVLLEVADICAGYGDAIATREVSIVVRAGEIVTLSGRNGAGKTTLLRTVMGLHQQFTGTVRLGRTDITHATPHHRARLGLGWVPDDRGAYATLTVSEALSLSHVRSARSWTPQRVFDTFPSLARRRFALVNRLSGGEQQMLALARVLRMGSSVVLADEPTEGLSPLLVEQVGELLRQLRADGGSVLLVEQNIHFAATVADRHYLLAEGRIVAEHTRDELVHREHELLAHLGM